MNFRRRRKKKDRLQARLLNACAWCGSRIPEDSEVFAIGAKLKPGIDLTKDEGTIIPLKLERIDKVLPAIVPTADSPAKKEGKDLLFKVCSDECGTALDEALKHELSTVDEST